MKEILKKILQPKEPEKIFATVITPLAGNRYQVEDSQLRTHYVDADRSWNPGDAVSVSGGRIVGIAARINKPKIYEV